MGIAYFELDYLPGKQHFRCEAHHSTLSVAACASLFRKHKVGCSLCTGCSIGATHSGEKLKPKFSQRECCRCGRSDLRLIGGTVCVGCYNRTREFLIGRNAKGQRPVHADPVFAADVDVPKTKTCRRRTGGRRVSLDVPRFERVHFDAVCSPVEAVLSAMRKTGATTARPVMAPKMVDRVPPAQMGLFS